MVVPLHDYMEFKYLPEDPRQVAAIKKKAYQFYYNAISRMLYRHAPDGLLLHFRTNQEAEEGLKEAYNSIFGAHQLDPKLDD